MYEYYVQLEFPPQLQKIIDNDEETKDFVYKNGLHCLYLRGWSKNQIRSMFSSPHIIERIECLRSLS
jgi:hypothetical protein